MKRLLLLLICLILFSGCQQMQNFPLESGESVLLDTGNIGLVQSFTLIQDVLVWSDNSQGITPTCTENTCEYQLFALNLTSGVRSQLTFEQASHTYVDSFDETIVYQRRSYTCDSTCLYTIDIRYAPINNLSNHTTKYQYVGEHDLISVDADRKGIVFEQQNPFEFNALTYIDFSANTSTPLDGRTPKPDKRYALSSKPTLGGDGKIYFLRWQAGDVKGQASAELIAIDTERFNSQTIYSPTGSQSIDEVVRTNTGIAWVRSGSVETLLETANSTNVLYETVQNIQYPRIYNDEIFFVETVDDAPTLTRFTNNVSTPIAQERTFLNVEISDEFIAWSRYAGTNEVLIQRR